MIEKPLLEPDPQARDNGREFLRHLILLPQALFDEIARGIDKVRVVTERHGLTWCEMIGHRRPEQCALETSDIVVETQLHRDIAGKIVVEALRDRR